MKILTFLRLDSTLVELLSSLSLFGIAVMSFHYDYIGQEFFSEYLTTYWAFIFILVSAVHSSTILFFYQADLVRSLMCWVSAGVWLDHIVVHLTNKIPLSPDDVMIAILCCVCYYAFLANLMKVNNRWKR